jgi:hypothetical protein
MIKTNVGSKDNQLTLTLKNQFQGNINLARIKLISHLIIALCKVQTVTFEKLANAFDTKANATSSLRRIQRFIANYTLDSSLITRLIFSLLPVQEKLVLSMDRTNWKFGETNINIFMLGVVYKGVAFPLLFTMLDKQGNSNSQERIDLINRFINLFGKQVIDCIVADREFIGEQWFDFLNTNQLRYYIRIRNNFKVFLPHKNKEVTAFHLFNHLKTNEFMQFYKIVKVNNQYCYLSGMKIIGRKGKPDFLILVSFNKPEKSKEQYQKRWQIEMSFKAMKSSGFNIEKTHLTDIHRIEKLILIVMIAFLWAYKVGIFLHNIKPIKIKSHQRKAKSIFKYGLDFINNKLLNSKNQSNIDIINFLSCT